MSDTIAAIATGAQISAIGIIRLSGSETLRIMDTLFFPYSGRLMSSSPDRKLVFGELKDRGGELLDVCLCTISRGPNSYTGEDTAELQCHGSPVVMRAALDEIFALGGRQAGPGEFTKRAFINGKMDLSAAEAMRDLLEATSREQIALSHAGMEGKLSAALQAPYDEMKHLMASLYAAIDFPDEDLGEVSDEELTSTLHKIHGQLSKLADTYRTGHAIAEGIPTVLCGRVNAGKSTLFNRLVGRDAAIVTDVAGTTRDVLSETVNAGRVTLRLHDTAGLRETGDTVEAIGIERTKREMDNAELILFLLDASRTPDEEDRALAKQLQDTVQTKAAVICLLTKTDLGDNADAERLAGEFTHVVRLSGLTGEGVGDLVALIEDLFTDGTLSASDDAIVASARQYAEVRTALGEIESAIAGQEMGYTQDLIGENLENAMSAIGRVDGRTAGDEIVSEIFHNFCVGK